VPPSFENQVVLVTGAGRGIGRAIALAFAREGAQVVLLSRTKSELDEVAASSAKFGARARVVPADVTASAEVERAVAAAVAEHGTVDVAVAAAGALGPVGPLWKADPSEWERTLRVNLLGGFHLCRAVLPPMLRQGRGKIILVAGGGGSTPFPRFSAYAASKAAVVRLAETLADEVRESGVQVNALAPGLVDTRLLREVEAAGPRAGEHGEHVRLALAGSNGLTPEGEVAALALFLASSDSGALTGKLVSAPHDPWREWAGRAEELNATPLYTLRRLDPFTLESLRASARDNP
jgi:NAD(P)-dependent dehydrogenase (short-subunit alcohol dehydrogenase family)